MSACTLATVDAGVKTTIIPLVVSRGSGGGRQPVSVGVPFPRGALWDAPASAWFESSSAAAWPGQTEPLVRWPDGSIQWLLVDGCIDWGDEGGETWQVRVEGEPPAPPRDPPHGELGAWIECGGVRWQFAAAPAEPAPRGMALGAGNWSLTDPRGRTHEPTFAPPRLERNGPVRTTIRQEGAFAGLPGMRLVVRWNFYPSAGLVKCDATLHNARRARHPGGIWELGDAGSWLFKDFSFRLPLAAADFDALSVTPEPGGVAATARQRLHVYQDSSGGENWRGQVHVNRAGVVPCRFRGYQIQADAETRTGLRASPTVRVEGRHGVLSLAAPEFWQNFPKALEVTPTGLRFGLFPGEFGDLHELQGGERKCHTFWLQLSPAGAAADGWDWAFDPTTVAPALECCLAASVLPELRLPGGPTTAMFEQLVDEGLQGPAGVLAHREPVDEYGWRHFGDMFADHEAVYFTGDGEFVSHFNNQFDVVLGLLWQHLRTGDRRYFRLADQLARHVMDVDVYHTQADRAAYNGGMFWFTDHYRTARRATHRTYARENAPPAGAYGGGPSAEHNYTSGLTLYYCLTGCPAARETVLELADWVVTMEDGARTPLGLVDDGPTGTATVNLAKPSRGGGNSINALLDAWTLTREPKYLALGEDLIRRCVHPSDEVAGLNLLDAEKNWSYTMFLTSLARYLALKEEADQCDARYALARASLLHYAQWMLDCECPYLSQADRLEYPTEAWAAQELRKANVFRRAARFAPPALAERLRARGDEFGDRAWRDLMSFQQTRATIRAIALVMTEGLADCVWRQTPEARSEVDAGAFEFPPRPVFLSQRQRVAALARSPRGWFRLASRLMNPWRWQRWRRRRAGSLD